MQANLPNNGIRVNKKKHATKDNCLDGIDQVKHYAKYAIICT
jgi:hypothetical protein